MTKAERYQQAKTWREAGWTFKAIGQALGLSGERSRQIVLYPGQLMPLPGICQREGCLRSTQPTWHYCCLTCMHGDKDDKRYRDYWGKTRTHGVVCNRRWKHRLGQPVSVRDHAHEMTVPPQFRR